MENTTIFFKDLQTDVLVKGCDKPLPLILASACFLSGLQPAFTVIWPLCNQIFTRLSLWALRSLRKMTFLETCLCLQRVTGDRECDTSPSLLGLQTDVMFLYGEVILNFGSCVRRCWRCGHSVPLSQTGKLMCLWHQRGLKPSSHLFIWPISIWCITLLFTDIYHALGSGQQANNTWTAPQTGPG